MDYYYRNNLHQEEGPIPEEILREWLKMGQINDSTSVRRGDSTVWMSASAAFTTKISPSVLLSSSSASGEEDEDSSMFGPKTRIVVGAAVALLLFITYQKVHRNSPRETPVAVQTQAPVPPDASHKVLKTGLAHLYGIQCPVNISAARQCFADAASQNDCCGAYWQYVAADRRLNDSAEGGGVLNACAQLAKAGDSMALLCLAIEQCCSDDQTSKQKGMEILCQVAKDGDPVAGVEFGRILSQNENNPEARQQGFLILKDFSERGMVRADRYLSLCYFFGSGTEKNIEKSMELMRRAADNGDPEAVRILKGN